MEQRFIASLAAALSVLLGATACEDDPKGLRVEVAPAYAAMAEAMLEGVEGFAVVPTEQPSDTAAIALVAVETCAGCYLITPTEAGVRVEGDAPSGLAYGLTEALETAGYRFAHPFDTMRPAELQWPPSLTAAERTPEVARRGLQLHTLHPIEALEPLLAPGEDNLRRARQIVTWICRHRGNYVQWVLLDEIQPEGDRRLAPWRAHTEQIIEHAHRLGMEVGLAIQLFGSSNLQKAFDLIDDLSLSEGARDAEVQRRLALLAELGIDEINVNFGEFSGEAPAVFIAELEKVARALRATLGEVGVSATIHVGDSEDTRVVYMGQDLIYYFLVQFVTEPLVPWVHTVMWYALDDDAGGVYHHEDFSEHRDFIAAQMAAGKRVVYFPETAYWVAWDNTIPMYAPIYPKVRVHDLDLLAALPGDLYGHVIFSSGWEWGYWQNDLVSLRASYARRTRWVDELSGIYGGGAAEAALLDRIEALADLQHRSLVDERLAPYLAGRDVLIEAGFTMGIVGQPDRVEPEDLPLPTDEHGAYEAVTGALAQLADSAEAEASAVTALDLPDSRWSREMTESFVLFALRARFVATLHVDLLAGADGQTLDKLDALLESAQAIVDRRHADLHDPAPDAILANRRAGPTLYDYGYLREANDLCFWRRERAKVAELLDIPAAVPSCVL